jgi:hypothetical protein
MRRLILAVALAIGLVSGYFVFLIAREEIVARNAYAHFGISNVHCDSSATKCSAELVDRVRSKRYAATVERIAGRDDGVWPQLETFRYRITLDDVHSNPIVSEFNFAERATPRYRGILAKLVTPVGIGFYSQVTNYWPTLLFPIVFPFGSAVASVSILCLFARRRFRPAL